MELGEWVAGSINDIISGFSGLWKVRRAKRKGELRHEYCACVIVTIMLRLLSPKGKFKDYRPPIAFRIGIWALAGYIKFENGRDGGDDNLIRDLNKKGFDFPDDPGYKEDMIKDLETAYYKRELQFTSYIDTLAKKLAEIESKTRMLI
jgi:hypothetical protein